MNVLKERAQQLTTDPEELEQYFDVLLKDIEEVWQSTRRIYKSDCSSSRQDDASTS